MLRKWGNGVANRDVTLGRIFHLCRDIRGVLMARHGEGWQSSEPVILEAGGDVEYDSMALRYEDFGGKEEGIWVDSLERGDEELEITSSVLIARDYNKGRERFKVYIPAVPVYIPLLKDELATDALVCVELNRGHRRTLFKDVRAAFMLKVLEESQSEAAS